MIKQGRIVRGKYLDSVKLMLISKQLRQENGVLDAVAMTASPENRAILKTSGFFLADFSSAHDTDIVIAVETENELRAQELLGLAQNWIEHGLPDAAKSATTNLPHSLGAALQLLPGANLALISVAGKFAAAEADKALEQGLHVLLFSDNVSLEDELALKRKALNKGLLMMGPDCGTAIINGVPLAFSNKVRQGAIGIVSASGTGLQEVSCQIHNLGAGVSQAFGTGGRDGKAAIGGLMLSACLDYLIEDVQTKVIVLISKVPDPQVIDMLWTKFANCSKPIVLNFLKDVDLPVLPGVMLTETLADTARQAVKLLGDIPPGGERELFQNRRLINLPKDPRRKYLRALYSGGTLCYEAQRIFAKETGILPFSNAPLQIEAKLSDALISKEHTVIDLGSDEFTVGRLHPMIDYSLRLSRIKEELRDPETAVLLLDIVLGYGAHPAPAGELKQVLSLAGEIVVICAVVGTEADPQNKAELIKTLQETGAVLTANHAEACSLAAGIINNLRRDNATN